METGAPSRRRAINLHTHCRREKKKCGAAHNAIAVVTYLRVRTNRRTHLRRAPCGAVCTTYFTYVAFTLTKRKTPVR